MKAYFIEAWTEICRLIVDTEWSWMIVSDFFSQIYALLKLQFTMWSKDLHTQANHFYHFVLWMLSIVYKVSEGQSVCISFHLFPNWFWIFINFTSTPGIKCLPSEDLEGTTLFISSFSSFFKTLTSILNSFPFWNGRI